MKDLAKEPTASTYTTYIPVNPPTSCEKDANTPVATSADTKTTSGPPPSDSQGARHASEPDPPPPSVASLAAPHRNPHHGTAVSAPLSASAQSVCSSDV